MKRKNGFTLIELVVVIALIAILAVTLAPRLRDQIAKAGDSKAIAVLGALRTQSEVYFADNQVPIGSVAVTSGSSVTQLSTLIADLDNSSKKLFNEAGADNGTWTAGEERVPLGGTRTAVGQPLSYGGEAGFTFATDNIEVLFDAIEDAGGADLTEATAADTKDKVWIEY